MTLLWTSNCNCHLTLGTSERNFILQLYLFNRDIILALITGFTCMSSQAIEMLSSSRGSADLVGTAGSWTCSLSG